MIAYANNFSEQPLWPVNVASISMYATTAPGHERIALLPVLSVMEMVHQSRKAVAGSHSCLQILIREQLLTDCGHCVRVFFGHPSSLDEAVNNCYGEGHR